jgi:hypothetical protein
MQINAGLDMLTADSFICVSTKALVLPVDISNLITGRPI